MAYIAMPTRGAEALTEMYGRRAPQLFQTGIDLRRQAMGIMLGKRAQWGKILEDLVRKKEFDKQQREARRSKSLGGGLTAGGAVAGAVAGGVIGGPVGALVGAGVGAGVGGGTAQAFQGDPGGGARTISSGFGPVIDEWEQVGRWDTLNAIPPLNAGFEQTGNAAALPFGGSGGLSL